MNTINNEDLEWARLTYNNYINGTETIKKRQWLTANYVLLIFAVLIVYLKKYYGYQGGNDNKLLYIFLLFIPFIINSVGIYHIIDMHFVMIQYRMIAYQCAKQNDFIKKIDEIESDRKLDYKKAYFLSLTFFLAALIWIGLFFVLLFLYKLEKNNCLRCQIQLLLAISFPFDFILGWAITDKKKGWVQDYEKKLKHTLRDYRTSPSV
jgi:hypothetical protein